MQGAQIKDSTLLDRNLGMTDVEFDLLGKYIGEVKRFFSIFLVFSHARSLVGVE